MLNVPESLQQSAELLISLSSTGFTGNVVGLLADLFASNQQPIMITPFTITQDGAVTGIKITVGPGFTASFVVQYWRLPGSAPAPGSSITVSVDVILPGDQLVHAAASGLLNSSRAGYLQQALNVGPTPTAILGAATFIAGE